MCCKKNNRKQYCVGGGKIAVEDGNIFFKWGKKQNKVIDDGQKILFLGLAIRSGRCHFQKSKLEELYYYNKKSHYSFYYYIVKCIIKENKGQPKRMC